MAKKPSDGVTQTQSPTPKPPAGTKVPQTSTNPVSKAKPTPQPVGGVVQTPGPPPAHLPPGAAGAIAGINSNPITPVATTPPPTPAKPQPAQLNQTQQSIYDLMSQTLASWGLSTLTGELKNLIVGGDTSSDTLALALSQTKEYKARFAGNDARVASGLAALTPAEYLATEESYRNILNEYGIPRGFYDDKAATDKWIGGDVSASELNDRVKAASELVNGSPETMQAWNQFYGGGTGGAIAAILDSSKAAPLVEQQVAASEIGGAALQAGLKANNATALNLARNGVTLAQAQQAYSNIAQRMTADQSISARFGAQPFGQEQEEQATFLNDPDALNQQHSLYSEEKSQFSGVGGAATGANNSGSNY